MYKNPKSFEFVRYQFQPQRKRVVFEYKTIFEDGETILWTETIVLPAKPNQKPPQKLLEALHIMLGVSYWKFHCSKSLELPYQLTKQEAEFWNTVYKKGLGEFFYKNNLNPSISPKFPTAAKNYKLETMNYKLPARWLVGVGGGKDSIVSVELLKGAGHDITALHIQTGKSSQPIDDVIEIMGVGNLRILRILDEKVHQKHLYNGHIPISAVYAFLGVLGANLYGYKGLIVSNEYSSNFGNIKYKGLDVNHQWSKSFEFEQLFQNYVRNFISPDIQYFSLLRPFYEIRIAKILTKLGRKYFEHFSSCNRNFVARGATHKRLWCGQCAKCVFAWAMLSASLPKKELINIFGKDLAQEENLQPLFKDILGQGNMKPFDCVGTFEEAQEALAMASKMNPEARAPFQGARPSTKHGALVWQTQKENAVPDEFKFLGMETVRILRHEGLEGKATAGFLKKFYPKLKIVKGEADITIKTPGVNKSQITGYYTTPTNIFLGAVKNKNLIIGVTGSKGKSTTSSLIYHILKTAGKRVELLGNIGKPMLEALTKIKHLTPNTYFVLELSSYQLDDIHYSPDIAVVTNLFPEHMDFHGSVKAYYAAKKNISKYQSEDDHLIFCVKARQKYKTSLLGEHNQNNIEAAAQVARILHIPELKIKKAVESFKGLPHRLEKVGEYGGITFYDDAISTAPESTIMAIKALKSVDTIFLGGQDRGYNFSQLEKVIKQYKIKNIVLFPDSGARILNSTKGFNILRTDSMKEAVKFAYQNTQKGKICLLSCASPSYSLWKNFEEKGDQFKFFVKKLSNESPH